MRQRGKLLRLFTVSILVFILLPKKFVVHSLASPSSTTPPRSEKCITILYAGKPEQYASYHKHLQDAFDEIIDDLSSAKVTLTDDLLQDPASIDYILYNPSSALQDFAPYTHVKAVLSLRAGVDEESNNPTLSRDVPLTRLVDPVGLKQGMVEYVVGHVLRYHLQTDVRWHQNQQRDWNNKNNPPLLAHQRTVGILGLGELGGACADALRELRFSVRGWSRTAQQKVGVHCCHGPDGLDQVLQESDILVLLLPHTPDTQNLLCRETFGQCKPGGVYIVNAGRGTSIQDQDLLEALDDGTVAGATLDVFREEPLPPHHAFWEHPKILVTPHVAAKTRADTASRVLADNIRRREVGEPMLYMVDREAGY